MNPKPNPELTDAENPAWTDEDFAHAIPFAGLPAAVRAKLGGDGHRLVREDSNAERIVSVDMAEEIVARFRVMGPDWNAHINAALADWLRTHEPEDLLR